MARLSSVNVTKLRALMQPLGAYLDAESAANDVRVRVADVVVAPNAMEARLKLSLSAEPRDTVVGSFLTRNHVGAWEGGTYVKTSGPFVFHPGDPTSREIVIPLKGNNRVGWSIEVIVSSTIAGAKVSDGSGLITFSADTQTQPPSGWALKYESNFVGIEITDSGVGADGATRCWQSRPDHGRTQNGNAELGLYVDPVLFPGTDPFPIVDGKRILRSEKLTTPIAWAGKSWNYTASMITSRMLPEARVFPGMRVECRLAMPVLGKRGAWPAFWLLENAWPHVWPPEVDLLEWPINADHKPFIYYTTQHWPGPNKVGYPVDIRLLDIPNVTDLTDFHTYGVTITDEKMLFDFDGKKTCETENRSPGKSWYVLLNMAMGGYWPGSPNASTVFPCDMVLDWIRIYEPAT